MFIIYACCFWAHEGETVPESCRHLLVYLDAEVTAAIPGEPVEEEVDMQIGFDGSSLDEHVEQYHDQALGDPGSKPDRGAGVLRLVVFFLGQPLH